MNDMAHGAAEVLPVTAIRISKTNPRKHFDQAALDELSASVRAHGIIQPLLVRPLANGANATFELVAGERRLRAFLATLPNERLALYMLLAAAEEDGYDGDGALLRSIAMRRGIDVAAIQAAAVAKAKADRGAAASAKPKKGGR